MTTPTPRIYSVDTSALIDGLERYYPEATFPAIWTRVDALISAGRFLISEEVFVEASAVDAPVKEWCSTRRHAIVVPTDATIATHVAGIASDFPTWGAQGRNQADPFVIAVAIERRATVVTGEQRGTAQHPKIPYVCDLREVPCITFLDLLQTEGWVFA
jgi:Domain of unknown function (DUF4411)